MENGGGQDDFHQSRLRGIGRFRRHHLPYLRHCQRIPFRHCRRTDLPFDFYRIKKLEEVYDMGYEDYFYSGALCFIEWPELVEELLPGNTIKVTIEEVENGERKVTLESFE